MPIRSRGRADKRLRRKSVHTRRKSFRKTRPRKTTHRRGGFFPKIFSRKPTIRKVLSQPDLDHYIMLTDSVNKAEKDQIPTQTLSKSDTPCDFTIFERQDKDVRGKYAKNKILLDFHDMMAMKPS